MPIYKIVLSALLAAMALCKSIAERHLSEPYKPNTLLYHKVLNDQDNHSELIIDEGVKASYTAEGLNITDNGGVIHPNKYTRTLINLPELYEGKSPR